MLKKIIIASALVLGFAGSFQFGQARSAQDKTITMKVGLVPEASACPCDWNDDAVPQALPFVRRPDVAREVP